MPLSLERGRRVSALALSCLEGRQELAEVWIKHTLAEGYGEGIVASEDLRETAYAVFELLLRSIAGKDVTAETKRVSERIGRRRAAQGVPLDSLLAAARMDAQVLWNALLSRATQDDFPELLASAPLVWEVVERHTLRIMDAYQETVLEQRRKVDDERRSAFDQLIQTGGRHPATVLMAAQVLSLDPQGQFSVVIADRRSAGGLRRVVERLNVRGIPTHTQELSSNQVPVSYTHLTLPTIYSV